MTLFGQEDGKTPLSAEEQGDLIPNLATREELNEWERQNILEAHVWALDARNIGRQDPLAEAYVRELHRRMFDQTWKWAGRYRSTEKNIGIPFYQIRDALAALLGDARYWLENRTYAPDEVAVRFHHRLVFHSSLCQRQWPPCAADGGRAGATARQACLHLGRGRCCASRGLPAELYRDPADSGSRRYGAIDRVCAVLNWNSRVV